MGLLTSATGRRMMDGTARIFLAELLFPLTALITTGFLTRQFGPQGYGLLALALTTIIWVESAITSFFAKATIKFVGETSDWKPVGAMVVRLSLKVGIAAMVLVWLLAAPLSVLLNEPDLALYLRVCAVDIPLLCVGQAYRNVLIGMGNYQGGAVARAGRWLTRLFLVVVLVEAGLSITGALLGVIGSSVAELLLSRWYLGSGMFIKQARMPIPIQRYGALLFLSSLCLIFFNGMDLFMLKILGGTAAQAGIYSAAQSLSLLPGLFSWTFSSLLLATLSRQLADRQGERARELARDAMRVTLWLVPVAAIIAGAAPEIVGVVFGTAFLPAGPLLALLIVGAVANVMLMVSLTIMTALGLPARTVMFTAPLVPLALGGHLLLIPRLGQQGAALVTVGVSLLGASVAVASVYALWKVWPPVETLLRSLLIGLVVGAASLLWPTSGLFVFAKLIVLGMISLLGYWWIGEFRQGEIAVIRSWLFRKTEPVQVI
ncbi:MAG: oligosaccharide flippase family protein [Nitrospirae bacterium]|nr:oligosaccharide flippase family protein [Nitrospirota bacterium]